jgi:hypothetical protein
MSNNSRLLIDEPPMVLLPSLAMALGGADAALLLQQLHYTAQRIGEADEAGRRWVAASYPELQTLTPWLSERTVRRIAGQLVGRGLLISEQRQAARGDVRNSYAIDYNAVDSLATAGGSDETRIPSGQSGQGGSGQSGQPDLFIETPDIKEAKAQALPKRAGPGAGGGRTGGEERPRRTALPTPLSVEHIDAARHVLQLLAELTKLRQLAVVNPRNAESVASGMARSGLPPRELVLAWSWATADPWWIQQLIDRARWTRPAAWVKLYNAWRLALTGGGEPRRRRQAPETPAPAGTSALGCPLPGEER